MKSSKLAWNEARVPATMGLPSLHLDAFYACARIGNFTKAAEHLHITQSALSQRIKNLEEELGVSLFVRDRSGIRLTESGTILLRYCQARDSIENEVLSQIRGGESSGLSGMIRIGGFSSIMRSVILPSLADLIARNSQVKVSFVSRELDELPAMLRNGEIDYMILDRDLGRDDLVTERLGVETNVLIKRSGTVPEVYLDHDEHDQTTLNYLKLNRARGRVERRYFDDVYGIIEAAKLGLGKAVAPLHLVRNEEDLVIASKEKPLHVPVVLHFYRHEYYSKLHGAVVEALKKNSAEFL